MREILADRYVPQSIRGVNIPKHNDERMIPQGEYLVDIQRREPLAGGMARMGGWAVAQSPILEERSISKRILTEAI